jgi:tryptophan synthase alpha chain
MSRLSEAFEKTKAEKRALLLGYQPAGFPSVEGTIAAFEAMIDAGVDAVEVGLPYSDPVIDGPTIQEAADASLRAGTRIRDVLHTVERIAPRVPAVIMTYWNPVLRYGVDRFAADLASAGGAGLITPDLIPDEGAPWIAASDKYDLDRVFLVSPSSPDERIAAATAACRGFVYATSVMGVTGARDQTSSAAPTLVARVRNATSLPVGVGLGVRNGAQAAEVASFADAVIVGSAFVRCLLDAPDETAGATAAAALAADLAAGVRKNVG